MSGTLKSGSSKSCFTVLEFLAVNTDKKVSLFHSVS